MRDLRDVLFEILYPSARFTRHKLDKLRLFRLHGTTSEGTCRYRQRGLVATDTNTRQLSNEQRQSRSHDAGFLRELTCCCSPLAATAREVTAASIRSSFSASSATERPPPAAGGAGASGAGAGGAAPEAEGGGGGEGGGEGGGGEGGEGGEGGDGGDGGDAGGSTGSKWNSAR